MESPASHPDVSADSRSTQADRLNVLQLAAIQFRPIKGDLSKTLDHMVEAVAQAAEGGADLIVLPESALTGYTLEGAVENLAVLPEWIQDELAKRLTGVHRPIDLAIGLYEQTPRRPYNSSVYLEWDGSQLTIKHLYRKFFLPTYGVFDEHRFHEEGAELGILRTRFGPVGILICEDVWHSILSTLLCVAGAELILIHSASPARNFSGEKPGNVLRYDRMIQALCEEHGVFAAMAMLAGSEGGKGLAGGSQIVDPFGNLLVQAQNFGEQTIIAEIDLNRVRQARAATPLASDLRERWPQLLRLANQLD